MRNLLNVFFRFVADMVNGAERSFLDFLSALVPYFVPIIPAYLTYYHALTEMGFPVWVAMTAAFVVETLGLTSVSTAIRFKQHNKKYKTEGNQAPFKLAVFVYIFYIVVVITVNVILEIVSGTRGGWIIVSIALFSLLSFPASVMISIRAEYGELLEGIRQRYQKPGSSMTPEPQSGTLRKEKHASDYRDRIIEMLEAEHSRSGQVLAPKQITARLKLNHANNKGFVSTLTAQWRNGKGIR